jgi:antitoxin Phd
MAMIIAILQKASLYAPFTRLRGKNKTMEDQYTIAEAKNRLPAIIHAVEKGPPIKLTRHGRPVAVLLSVEQYERLSLKKEGYWRALRSFRRRMESEDALISDEDFKGLRDHSRGREVDLV